MLVGIDEFDTSGFEVRRIAAAWLVSGETIP
jgi:hypothetical protein